MSTYQTTTEPDYSSINRGQASATHGICVMVWDESRNLLYKKHTILKSSPSTNEADAVARVLSLGRQPHKVRSRIYKLPSPVAKP